MSRVRFILLGILVIAFAGCGKTSKETTEQQPAAQQPAVQPAPPAQPAPESTPQIAEPEKTAPVSTPHQKPEKQAPAKKAKLEKPAQAQNQAPVASATPTPTEAQPPAATAMAPSQQTAQAPILKQPQFATVPSGTKLHVRLQDPLDSGVNKSGDTFRAILDQDVEVDGKVVAARGSLLQGKLSQVAQSGRVEGRASMSLQLVSLAAANQTYPIQTEILSFQAESTKKQDATKVGVGAGLGAVIGAIAGGGKGAAIGAAVGAGAGGATVAATRGKELRFDAEYKLDFALTRDISIKLQ